MLGLGLTACGSSPKGTNGDQDELAMLIGTYTNGSSKGIYTFRFNQETGTAVPLSSAALPNPSYLVPSGDGEFVYAVSEMNDSTAALSSLSLDRETGELRLLNTVPTSARPLLRGHQWPGSVDCQLQRWNHVRLSFTERRHFGSCRHALSSSATGPDAIRQATPHIHCTVFSPDGKYIFATDFSADRILRFVMHPDNPIPHASLEAVGIEADSGPRHLTFSPNGKFAYLITELSGKVIASVTTTAAWNRYRLSQPTP